MLVLFIPTFSKKYLSKLLCTCLEITINKFSEHHARQPA